MKKKMGERSDQRDREKEIKRKKKRNGSNLL